MQESQSYQKLQKMIGLGSVKRSVTSMLEMIKTNYERELIEKQPHQVRMPGDYTSLNLQMCRYL